MTVARTLLPLAVVILLVGGVFGQQAAGPAMPVDQKASVLAQIDPAAPGKGLRIAGPIKVSASQKWPVPFSVSVVNLLEGEVFLTVQGSELSSLGYDLRFELPDGVFTEHNGTGGAGLVFPDNTGLLKRLHACLYLDGKARPCGCATARLRGTIGQADDGPDLKTVVGAKGTVTLPIRGFFRTTGKEFSQDVEVSILVVE